MAVVNACILVINLNVNGLNSPIKRNRVAEWIKHKTQLYAAYGRHISNQRNLRLKQKGWKILQANGIRKKGGRAIPTADKINFKPKKVNKRQRMSL